MKPIKLISILIVVVILGGALTVKMLTKYVPIGMTGVRTQEYGIFGKRGIIPRDFGPGWHRNLGPIDTWVLFDSTVQTLTMPVQVQSADGYAVSVDMTTKYRIMEGMAHKLYQDTGSGVKYKTIVQNEAQRAYLALFGQMKTEDFYNPQQRREGARKVKADLAAALEDNFVEVIDILIRDLRFDPQYEKKIQRKKLADQEV
ncbi:hypothetical protein GF377_05260, partial [candidate division GN15 bacterium]|nr:hypothetical protein [candidate division GN15 bacterium]